MYRRFSVAIQHDIERLQKALVGIEHKAATAATADRAQARRGGLVEFESLMKRRSAAVAELAKAIETASQAYATFIAESHTVAERLPSGCQMPNSLNLAAFEYLIGGQAVPLGPSAAIAAEMFRTAVAPHLRLPGSKAPTLQFTDDAAAIEPLVAAAERVAEFVIRDVRKQVERLESAEAEALRNDRPQQHQPQLRRPRQQKLRLALPN